MTSDCKTAYQDGRGGDDLKLWGIGMVIRSDLTGLSHLK